MFQPVPETKLLLLAKTCFPKTLLDDLLPIGCKTLYVKTGDFCAMAKPFYLSKTIPTFTWKESPSIAKRHKKRWAVPF